MSERFDRAMRRARRSPVVGAPIRSSVRSRARDSVARDRTRQSSDAVWGLVERMLQGGPEAGDAARILDDVIEEGVDGGATRFLRIHTRVYKRRGTTYPAKLVPNHYAALTPGRSIVLFGLSNEWTKGGSVLRGYIRRFMLGDEAIYGSYNLTYLGKIKSITPQRISIADDEVGRSKVLDLQDFDSKNYTLDLEDVRRRNREEMQNI